MVDTGDLKSPGPYRLCGFESHFLYSSKIPCLLVKRVDMGFYYKISSTQSAHIFIWGYALIAICHDSAMPFSTSA